MLHEEIGKFEPLPHGREGMDFQSQEVHIDLERENVLWNLLEARNENRRVGPYIVEQLLTDSSLLVITGQPGVGKTTLLTDVKEAVEKNASRQGKSIKITVKMYDNYLKKAEDVRGSRKRWEDGDWDYLNDLMYEDLRVKDVYPNSTGTREVVLAELPGIGKTRPRDRGVGAVNKLYEDEGKKEKPDSLFVFVTPNKLLQLNASFLRGIVLNELSYRDVVPFLREHNHIVEGFWKDTEKGFLVKKLFQRAANADHISRIDEEESEIIGAWYDSMIQQKLVKELSHNPSASRDAREYENFIRQRSVGMQIPLQATPQMIREVYERFGAHIPDNFANRKSSFLTTTLIETVDYREHMLHEQFKLDKDTGIIVHNTPNNKTHVITADLLNELN